MVLVAGAPRGSVTILRGARRGGRRAHRARDSDVTFKDMNVILLLLVAGQGHGEPSGPPRSWGSRRLDSAGSPRTGARHRCGGPAGRGTLRRHARAPDAGGRAVRVCGGRT